MDGYRMKGNVRCLFYESMMSSFLSLKVDAQSRGNGRLDFILFCVFVPVDWRGSVWIYRSYRTSRYRRPKRFVFLYLPEGKYQSN